MRISDVIRRKGDLVVTIRPDDTVEHLLAVLEERGIGALVVSEDGQTVAGIVSERDVVRHLHHDGTVVNNTVRAIMTSEVETCGPDASLEELMKTMTELRVRHVPVVDGARVLGIISIGDVVKHRIDQLQFERDQLDNYVHQA